MVPIDARTGQKRKRNNCTSIASVWVEHGYSLTVKNVRAVVFHIAGDSRRHHPFQNGKAGRLVEMHSLEISNPYPPEKLSYTKGPEH